MLLVAGVRGVGELPVRHGPEATPAHLVHPEPLVIPVAAPALLLLIDPVLERVGLRPAGAADEQQPVVPPEVDLALVGGLQPGILRNRDGVGGYTLRGLD